MDTNRHWTAVISAVLSVILLCSVTLAAAAEDDLPVPVSTKEQLNRIRDNLAGNYYLTEDLVFTEADFAPGGDFYNAGAGFIPIGSGKKPFTGSFDGKGHLISGLRVSVSGKVYTMDFSSTGSDDGWTGDYIIGSNPGASTVSPGVGLFGVSTGTVRNVTIADSTVQGGSTNQAAVYVGGLIGYNAGEVSCCAVNGGTVIGDMNSYVGGLIGYQNGGSVRDCFARLSGISSGVHGGLVGALKTGTVTTSYSAVSFPLAAGAIGLVIDASAAVSNCFYISDTAYGETATAVRRNQSADAAQYNGFDFDTNWYLCKPYLAPALRGLSLPDPVLMGDVNNSGKVDLEDIVHLAQYLAGWQIEILLESANVSCDQNEDGSARIALTDVVYLAQHLAGWEDREL